MKKSPVVKALIWGLSGSLSLLAFYYLTLLAVTKDFNHPLDQFRLYQPWMGWLVVGFGVQLGLYSLLRSGIRLGLKKQDKKAGVVTGVGAGVSGVSMAACCAHHLVEILPIIGVSGAAIFLSEYQKQLLILGGVFNLVGIGVMIWMLFEREKPGRAWRRLLINIKNK